MATASWARRFPFLGDEDRRSYEEVELASGRLARECGPDDPGSHARARELHPCLSRVWLRSQGATPNVLWCAPASWRPAPWPPSPTSAPRCGRRSSGRLYCQVRVLRLRRVGCQRVAEGSATVASARGRRARPPDSLRRPAAGQPSSGWAGAAAPSLTATWASASRARPGLRLCPWARCARCGWRGYPAERRGRCTARRTRWWPSRCSWGPARHRQL